MLLSGVKYLHALFLFALLLTCTVRSVAQYNTFAIPAIANGNSNNGRGPITSSLFHRSNAIYKAAELTPYLSSGDTIGKVGWSILTAGGSVTGNMKIYLVNTTDVTYNRSTTWATLLTTPTATTLVYNGSMTIPASATVYSVTLSTPFVYTGAGIYVAYEWTPSTTSTGALYNCNTDITGGQWNAQGASLPATLNLNSNFRAQVILGVVPKKIDASVDELYSLGKLPIPYANPHIVRTRITNKGKDTLFTWPITLNITGANTFTTTSYIDTLLPGGNSKYVDFAGFSPANTGNNILTVSVPTDSVSSNNSKTFNQTVNLNSYNYADPTLPSLGGAGFNGGTGDFVAKFKYTGTNKINQIGVNFFGGGQSVKIGIWDTSATGTPGILLWQSASFTSVTGLNTIPVNPKLAISGSFYVGVIQFNATNANFGFQNENPIRDKTFYYTSPTGSSTWSDFSVTNSPYRFMIEPRLELANDLSVTQLLSPLTGCLDTVSNQPISLRVMNVGLLAQNFASNNLSVRVSVTNPLNVTSTLPATVISTGTLASGDSITVNPVTNYNMNTPGTYTFKLWAGTTTEVNTNDTLTVTINVKPLPPVVTSTVTYCQNATATALTATGVNTLLWFTSSSGGAGSNTAPTPVTTSAGTTLYYVADSNAITGCISARALITVNVTAPVANNSITSLPQIICSGSSPTTITASTPTGGSGTTYTYSWLSSTTSATTGFAVASGTVNTQNYSPAALTQAMWFRRKVISGACAADTSAAIKVDINLNSTWNGSMSTDWADPDNWSNGVVPCNNSNVTIPALSFNYPIISVPVTVNKLNINSGASLTLLGANAQLNLLDSFINNGLFTSANGTKINFNGSSQQIIPAGNYAKLQINNTAGAILGGSVTLSDSLLLTNGILYLDANNLTLGTNSYAGAGSANSFIKTNGFGSVIVNGVGGTGKTGNVIIPIGNATFNPVKLLNAGTTDNFTLRLFDSVTANYSGSSSVGNKLPGNVVDRTWIINEGTAGGSNATVTLQWNTIDELPGFTRFACFVSRYNGTFWVGNPPSAAIGSNPYTQTLSGITAFSPFSIANLAFPVELISFKGEENGNKVLLTWATASEINNDHFTVERSFDNVNFTAIGTVKGAGTSSRINTYNFTDIDAIALAQPTLYYRLKQVDMDGTFTYSTIVVINLNKGNHTLETITPNPFDNALKITFNGNKTVTHVQVKITDINGRIVSERTVSSPVDIQFINLDNLANLTTGMYNVLVVTNGETNIYKVVKN